MEEQQTYEEQFPVDLWDLGLAVIFGINPTPIMAVALAGQYIVRHSQSVRETLTLTLTNVAHKALPAVQRALPEIRERDLSPSPRFVSKTNKTPALPTVTIDQIARGDNILLVGGKGTGKSTLLDALVKRREGLTVVLDPHYAPGSWQGAKRIVGKGLDFESITTFLGDLELSLLARYREMAQGKRNFNRLTVCGDEWRAISQSIEGAGKTFTSVLTQGRKVRLCVLAASHNDTVAALGCKGDKESFVNSFDWIIYTGAFATDRFPATMEIPLIPTEHGDIPALAFAVNVNQQKDYALDLRDVTTSTVLTEQDKHNLLNELLNAHPNGHERSSVQCERSERSGIVQAHSQANERLLSERSGDAVQNEKPEENTLSMSESERQKMVQAIELFGQGKSKKESLETAWEVKKGGSQVWQRASKLFDAVQSGTLSLDGDSDLLDGYLGHREG